MQQQCLSRVFAELWRRMFGAIAQPTFNGAGFLPAFTAAAFLSAQRLK
jgi:hypothetical protein